LIIIIRLVLDAAILCIRLVLMDAAILLYDSDSSISLFYMDLPYSFPRDILYRVANKIIVYLSIIILPICFFFGAISIHNTLLLC